MPKTLVSALLCACLTTGLANIGHQSQDVPSSLPHPANNKKSGFNKLNTETKGIIISLDEFFCKRCWTDPFFLAMFCSDNQQQFEHHDATMAKTSAKRKNDQKKSKQPDDVFDPDTMKQNENSERLLDYTYEPTAPPTQAVEWLHSKPGYYTNYGGVSMSSTGQYAVSFNENQGISFSDDYGGYFDYAINDETSTFMTTSTGTWTNLKMSASGLNVVALAAYVGVAFSSDYGYQWTISTQLSSSVQWTALAASSALDYIYAFPNTGAFAYSSDSGASFTTVSWVLPMNVSWTSATCSSTGQYVAVTANYDYIYVSSDWGSTWSAMTNPLTNGWSAIASSASGLFMYALATTSSPGVYASADYGYTWTLTSFDTSVVYSAITTDDAGANVFVAGSTQQGIYTSSDYGASWSVTTAPYTSYVSIACNNDSSSIMAASNPNGESPHY